jgi:hypothetical protein
MRKTEVEKKLKSLAKKMQKTFLEYLDSLGEEGNEIGKKEGYLSVTIWRESIDIVTTHSKLELKKENQISLWESNR